jgi:hypothetical protein
MARNLQVSVFMTKVATATTPKTTPSVDLTAFMYVALLDHLSVAHLAAPSPQGFRRSH